jgi:glycosyltransferase involved in cell wall biosynthesis
MKIVYFLNEFPTLSQSFILNEVVGLENRGHNVTVIARNNPGESIQHDELADLEADIYYIDSPSYIDLREISSLKVLSRDFSAILRNNSSIKYKLAQAYYAKRLLDIIERENLEPELLFTHFATEFSYSVEAASSYIGIPWGIEVHAYDIFRQDNVNRARHLLQYPDRIITVSEYNKRYIEEELGIPQPTNVVPVSVHPEKFQPGKYKGVDNRILTVARLVEKKGIKYGIEAVEKLRKDYGDIEYHIVGKGPLRERLEEKVKEKGLQDDVKFLGHISDERLIREYDEASVFLLPCVIAENGDRDAMPMVLKEAMSMKTPCVSTDVSAIPELIQDGETGFIVDSRDADGLAEATTYLLGDSEKRESFGKDSRKRIEKHFSLEENVRELEAIFQKTVQ